MVIRYYLAVWYFDRIFENCPCDGFAAWWCGQWTTVPEVLGLVSRQYRVKQEWLNGDVRFWWNKWNEINGAKQRIKYFINRRSYLCGVSKDLRKRSLFAHCIVWITNCLLGIQCTQRDCSTIWGRATGYGRGRLGPKISYGRARWEIETGGEKISMADEEDRIRRCVREELELNLVSRTRSLIRSAASSSVNDLNNA